MRRITSYLALVLFGLMILGVTGASAKKKGAVVWPSENIKWSEMKGGPPGGMYANLWGNMQKGAFGALVKLPAGMNNPLHTHSADLKLVIMSGSFWYQPEGGEKQVLGPGSYLMVPGGLRHSSGTDSECTAFQTGNKKFDMKAVKAKTVKAAKGKKK